VSGERVEVDARGERCPVPVVMAARATQGLPRGSVVEVIADDPVAAVDIPAWAWMRGHAVDAVEKAGWTVYTVRVGEGDDGGGSVRST
jgi:tRNA 2-thiouridine synthesizing protein A